MRICAHLIILGVKIAVAVSLFVPAISSTALGADIARGQTIVELYCARCHATGPTGESLRRAATPFRFLQQKYPIENLAEAFAEGIITGHPEMPEFKFLPEEIDGILAYLHTLQKLHVR